MRDANIEVLIGAKRQNLCGVNQRIISDLIRGQTIAGDIDIVCIEPGNSRDSLVVKIRGNKNDALLRIEGLNIIVVDELVELACSNFC